MSKDILDLSLETEEYITAEEYMRRRKSGNINPAKIRYALDPPDGKIGGFYVKLDKPRYRVAVQGIKGRTKNAK